MLNSYLYCSGLNHIPFRVLSQKISLNFVDFEVLNPILWDENEVKFQIAPKQSCNELMS